MEGTGYTSTWQLRRLRSLSRCPRSDKESPEVEIVQEKEEETTKDTEVEPDKDTTMVDVSNIGSTCKCDDEEDEIMMKCLN
ncbi:hypothetical protein Tco_1203890 [Tanacetum coccineum]